MRRPTSYDFFYFMPPYIEVRLARPLSRTFLPQLNSTQRSRDASPQAAKIPGLRIVHKRGLKLGHVDRTILVQSDNRIVCWFVWFGGHKFTEFLSHFPPRVCLKKERNMSRARLILVIMGCFTLAAAFPRMSPIARGRCLQMMASPGLMKAAVFVEKGKVEIQMKPIPTAGM